MPSTVVTVPSRQDVKRDPVLLLPVVVAAGLAIGAVGVQEHVAGTRISADLTLAWALSAAAVVVLERPRWRAASWLLGASALTILCADLEWTKSDALWTLGFLLEGLWIAFLAQLVLTFPEGRSWSGWARVGILGAFVVTFGGQVVGALVAPDARDLLSVAPRPSLAHTVDRAQEICGAVLALLVLFLVLRRLRALRRAAHHSQGPLLAAAAVTVLAGLVWLGSVIASDASASMLETTGRAIAVSLPIAVLATILWSRLRRPEASELVVELQTQGTGTMRERLARALGDPMLDVAYRLGNGRYVDAGGGAVELPHANDRAVTSVTAGGEEVAVLVHDPALLDDPQLVESVQATAGLVLENERLAAEVRSQLAEVRASRGRIVAAADAERRRIERNLHDGAQQRLVTLSLTLGLEASSVDTAAAEILSQAQDEVEEAITELRELARGIHPTLLRDEGLQAAVEALARRAPLPVTVHGPVRNRLPEQVELAAYFVIAEALTNVVKHASAAEASVLLEQPPGALLVTISDNGVGGTRITAGSGLAGLRDRLEALDATLAIESRPQQGTTIRTRFRCES
jgi:signal transduction histidine kinase